MSEKIKRELPDSFLEKLILKGMFNDPYYVACLKSAFKPDYFDDPTISKCYSFVVNHYEKYNQLPPRDVVVNSFTEDKDKISNIFSEIDSVDYDVSKNFDHLFEETNEYLKEKAFKDALLKGVDLIQKKQNPLQYKNIIEDALSKDLKIDLGTDYWGTLNERLRKVLTEQEVRIPSYFPMLDEYIAGGFPPYTLNVILSRIHGGKTNMLVNMAARQVLNGYSPLIISLEMGEKELAKRLDSIYSKLDINRIYIDKNLSRSMVSELKNIKSNNGLGNLIIKEFPTGKGTVADFEKFVRELHYRGIYPNPIYCDYLQIVGGALKDGKRHEEIGQISKDLRAMGLKYDVPIISCGQLNRAGMMIDFNEVDLTYVGQGIDIAADADFMAIFGLDEDSLVYESEIHYKLVKNRLGGRVGEIGKFYLDKRSLKLYDESELDQWIEDAKISGDKRKVKKNQ